MIFTDNDFKTANIYIYMLIKYTYKICRYIYFQRLKIQETSLERIKTIKVTHGNQSYENIQYLKFDKIACIQGKRHEK